MILEHKTLELHDKMLFEKARIRPPVKRPYPMPNEACFLYILKGANGTLSSKDSVIVREREALLMKCDNYLFRMLPSDNEQIYEAVAVHLYPDVLKKVFQNNLPDFLKEDRKASSPDVMLKLKVDVLLEKYFDSILFYFTHPELVNEDLLTLKIKELFLLLNKVNSAGLREIMASLFTPNMYSFREIIESHLYSSLTIAELAALTNLSLSSFKRSFKKIYQESPGRYLRNQKLKKASELLKVSGLNITEIAFECGFNDLANFSIAFKDRYGCSPSSYKST